MSNKFYVDYIEFNEFKEWITSLGQSVIKDVLGGSLGGLDHFFTDKIYFNYHFNKKQVESLLTLMNDSKINKKCRILCLTKNTMKNELKNLDNKEDLRNNIDQKSIKLNFQRSLPDNILNNSKIKDEFLKIWNAGPQDVDVILKEKNTTDESMEKSKNILNENLNIELCSESNSILYEVNPNILHIMLATNYNIASITRSKKTNSLFVNFTHLNNPIKIENMDKALSLINYVINNKKEMMQILVPLSIDGREEDLRSKKPHFTALNVLGVITENKLITNHKFLNEFDNFSKKDDYSNTM